MKPSNPPTAKALCCRIRALCAAIALVFSIVSCGSVSALTDDDWIRFGGIAGTDNAVRATASDGAGNLYIGGDFTQVGAVQANRVAKWNGTSWQSLGTGLNGTVLALATMGQDVYAGGNFTSAGGQAISYLAKWDGNGWSALGSGPAGAVSALAVKGSDLYAGGSFTTAGGATVNAIAKWNGSSWSALGTGMALSGQAAWVSSMAVQGSDLYVGGNFASAGGVAANNVARWTGSAWMGLGSGTAGVVSTLLFDGSTLHVGGQFASAGGVAAANVARWNGSAWLPMGAGVDGTAYSMALLDGNVVVGGVFTSAGGLVVNNVAQWNGTGWTALGAGVTRSPNSGAAPEVVYTLQSLNGALYVGGQFGMAAPLATTNLVIWRSGTWSNAGATGGPNAYVTSLGIAGNELYVGGNFDKAGAVVADRIAKWDGRQWSALALPRPLQGANGGPVAPTCFASIGSDLYVAGAFTNAGSVAAKGVAKWNGQEWSALGAGVDGSVLHMAGFGADLYVSGDFTSAGGVPAHGLAKWNGSQWSAVDTGMEAVGSLLVWNGELYITGTISVAGTPENPTPGLASVVAKKTPGGWSYLDKFFTGSVTAIAGGSSGLYAMEWTFSFLGDNLLRLWKWNGSAWSAMGPTLATLSYDGVQSLAVHGNEVFLGGSGLSSGSTVLGALARWNGSAWGNVGFNFPGQVFSLVGQGDDLYVGGFFEQVGSKKSPWIVRANLAGGVADADADGLLDSWEIAHFAFRDGHGPLDDDDFDGMPALHEEALGLDPILPDVSGEPPVVEEGGYLTMTVPKHAGVAYEVQTAGTLSSGQPDSFSAATTTILIDDATTLKVRDNVPLAGAPHRFMRLTVTAAP